jgi:hypothetical protein
MLRSTPPSDSELKDYFIKAQMVLLTGTDPLRPLPETIAEQLVDKAVTMTNAYYKFFKENKNGTTIKTEEETAGTEETTGTRKKRVSTNPRRTRKKDLLPVTTAEGDNGNNLVDKQVKD